MFLTGLIIGLFIGVIVGIFLAGISRMAKESDFNERGEYKCKYTNEELSDEQKSDNEGKN